MTFAGSALITSDPGWFHMKMTAVILGIIIAVTTFIAYNVGKNKGRFISEGQDNRNVQRK